MPLAPMQPRPGRRGRPNPAQIRAIGGGPTQTARPTAYQGARPPGAPAPTDLGKMTAQLLGGMSSGMPPGSQSFTGGPAPGPTQSIPASTRPSTGGMNIAEGLKQAVNPTGVHFDASVKTALEQAAKAGNTGAANILGAAPAPPAPAYNTTLDTQYGTGNPFQMQGWYGDNPLVTAETAAQRALDKNLAALRSRAAANGMGSGSRLALQEGEAVGEFGAQLGDALAARGIAARASDADRGLQAFLGAGQQQLMANEQLSKLGELITKIGVSEQGIPNADVLMQLLTILAGQSGTSTGKTTSQSESGYLAM